MGLTSAPPVPDRAAGLIEVFAGHPVACNLLIAIMLLAGAWSLTRLRRQFFPNVDKGFITVTATWTGASAEDVEAALTRPIERELPGLDSVREMISISNRGSAAILLKYEEGSDTDGALDQVQERVTARSVDLPAGSIGRNETSKQLHTLDRTLDAAGFESLALRSGEELVELAAPAAAATG